MLKGLLFTLLIFSFLFFNSFSQGKRFSSDNPSNEELNPVSQSELTFDQTAPDGSAILPGSWMIGVLADVSFPFEMHLKILREQDFQDIYSLAILL